MLDPVTVTASSIGGDGGLAGQFGGQIAGSLISGLFNRSSARAQMRFQERMANTQYQRAAADLQAAGLNRIIALGNPAAAPSGAMGSMSNIDFSAASASDVNRKNSVYQRELMNSQRDLSEAQIVNTDQATRTGVAQEGLYEEQRSTAKATAQAQKASATLAETEARIKAVEADWSERTGIPTSTLNSASGALLGTGAKLLPKLFNRLFK